MKKLLLSILFLGTFGCVFAHQPRLVFSGVQKTIAVFQPQISQAFYGNLRGKEDVYQIISETGFHFYVQLVVPMISGARKDFEVTLYKNEIFLASLKKKESERTSFYEPFAGDWYRQGPSFEKDVFPGVYSIHVNSPGLTGKYSLAIGKIESFPFHEILSTYRLLPSLKMDFFEKPRWTIFTNRIVGRFLVIFFFLGGSVYGVIFFKKKSNRNTIDI